MPAHLILHTVQCYVVSSAAAASISSETGVPAFRRDRPILLGGKQRCSGLPLVYAELTHAHLRTSAGHREMQGQAGGTVVALQPYNGDNE